ncbi:MAG: signal peptide peptidase SppA, partial [Bacteroidales bacterium]
KKTNNKIAVIYAQGEIGMDKGSSYSIGTENIKDAIKAAAADKNVKAIVLRVNSPGGSVLTSDIIYQEVILAQKKKPVVASFGNYAASGGYYISCAANKIYSEPTTLTGSIGVFGIIPNAKKLLNDKLGINFDEVSTNTNSGALSGVDRPLNKMELSLMQRNIENVYASFTSKVAKGRKMSVAEVDSIGQGRVWSGKDAIAIGLVDELGGLDAAISGAAKLAKLKAYKVEEFPKEPNPYTELISSLTTARVKVLNEDLTSTFGPELASWFMQIRALKFLDRPSVMARMDVIVIE